MAWNMRAHYDAIPYGAPGVVNEGFVRAATRSIGGLLRLWYRPRMTGFEHLPERAPYLIVANHSGAGMAEVTCLTLLWWKRFGVSRPIAGFAHPIAFRIPVMAHFLRAVGAVPSTYGAADAALSQGVPLLLFPGGDHEAFRPIWQARRIDFGGRKGFLRIAQKHRIPIVPLAIAGAHMTLPILWRSRALAWLLVWPRLIGIKRVPLTMLGLAAIVGAFLWGQAVSGPWTGALFAWLSCTLVPSHMVAWVPWTVRLRLLPAIRPEEIDDLDAAYARVTGALQQALLED